jgi:predicted nucleotidyltransferase
MYPSFDKINSEIKKYFSRDLVSIVIFGSAPNKKRLRASSDIDYIIISRKLKSHQDIISRILKRKLRGTFPLVAFNIYQKEEFAKILKKNPWLVLTIKLGYKTLFDKNDFFRRSVEQDYKKLTHQKIGWLAWYIEEWDPPQELKVHYSILSEKYLKSALCLYRKNFIEIALELLKFSIHCFMIEKLMARRIFATKGEITQLFFNIYSKKNKFSELRDSFLALEQKTNFRHSFDFNKQGNMFPLEQGQDRLKDVFKKAIKNFKTLNKSF